MSRTEWLVWIVRWGNPRTRSRNLRNFVRFELYSFGCLLCGYKIEHWLNKKSLPAGQYFVVSRPVPRGVKLLDKLFRPGKLAHADLIPYAPEIAEEIRRDGKKVEVMSISYRFGSASS